MARDKRPPRKSIRPYYFIVEGFTEENYLCLLKQLFKKSGIIKIVREEVQIMYYRKPKKLLIKVILMTIQAISFGSIKILLLALMPILKIG